MGIDKIGEKKGEGEKIGSRVYGNLKEKEDVLVGAHKIWK